VLTFVGVTVACGARVGVTAQENGENHVESTLSPTLSLNLARKYAPLHMRPVSYCCCTHTNTHIFICMYIYVCIFAHARIFIQLRGAVGQRERGASSTCSPLFLDWCLLCVKCVFPQVPSHVTEGHRTDVSHVPSVRVCVLETHTAHTHTHTHTHLGHEIHTAHTHTHTNTHTHTHTDTWDMRFGSVCVRPVLT
jgi:hypothetical protein